MLMAGAGKTDEPPGKKRKLEEENNENNAAAELWDDEDDLQLTQDQWKNLDSNVSQFLSQHPQNHVPYAPKTSTTVGKSPRSLGRGMPKSHSAGSFSGVSQNNSFKAAQTPPGNLGTAGLPNRLIHQRNHGIPSANRVLTPQAGSATVSPALPTQAKYNVPDQSEKLRKELEHYKQEMQSIKSTQYSKDGQITMLKKSLMEKERLLGQLHQEKIHQIESQAREQTEKEKSLEAELEKVQTQLQFKEHEIAELQSNCKRLEAKASSSSSDGGGSPRKSAPLSPRNNRSPRGISPRASQQLLFPNRRTFMEENKSAERPKRAKLFEDSPKPEKDATKEVLENTYKLDVTSDKGAITGGSLVAKLLSQQKAAGANSSMVTGLVSLMASSVDRQVDASGPSVVSKSPSQTEESNHKTSVKQKDSVLISQGVNDLLTSDCDCSPTVLLLPAIEDQIASFLDICNQSTGDRSKSPVVAGSSCDGHLDQKQAENELIVKNVEPVHNSLSLLLKITTWCGHSREALLNSQTAGSYSCSLLGVRGAPNSTQAMENQESEPTDSQLMPAQESLNVQNIVKKTRILDHLIQLARPKLPNGAAQKMQILHLVLKILGQVAHHVTADFVERLTKLFTEDILLQCLSPDIREDDDERVLLYVAVLDILCPLVKYSKVLDCMCAKKGDCLFNALYTAAGHSLQVTGPNRTVLTQKILQFINVILCQHENGSQVLLESDCQCSHQVARCVVTILHAELISFQKMGRQEQLMTLRQGISCLQTLSMVDRRGSVGVNDDAEIAHLVYSMERLMKDNKSVSELEIAALQDLWDFFDVEQSEDQEMNVA